MSGGQGKGSAFGQKRFAEAVSLFEDKTHPRLPRRHATSYGKTHRW